MKTDIAVKIVITFFVMVLAMNGKAAEREPLPPLKISGTIRPAGFASGVLNQPNAPARYDPTLNFETWLLGASFITRVTGTRLTFERIKETQQIGSVQLSDGSDFKRQATPYTFVIAYQPDDLTSSTDFPVRYYEASLDQNNTPRLNNMEYLSPSDTAWYAWWPLQRALLAAKGLPVATTSSVTMANDSAITDYYFPPKFLEDTYRSQDHYRCTSSPDSLIVQHLSHNWLKGRPDPVFQVQRTTYSKFHPQWNNLPLRAETDGTIKRLKANTSYDNGNPNQNIWISEISDVEELSLPSTFDEILTKVTKGLPRIFSQTSTFRDASLTSFTLKDFDGNSISMTRYGDKFVLLHFWASWGADNEKRFQEIGKIVDEFGDDPLFTAVSINFDSDRQAAEKVLDRVRPTWQQAYAGANAETARGFPFKTLPAAFLFAPTREKSKVNAGMGYGHTRLFGYGELHSDKMTTPADKVREQITLEKRRQAAGGFFAELFGEAGRAALKSADGAEAYLLMGSRDKLDPLNKTPAVTVPENADRFAHFPILYQWPDLPTSAAREIAALLLHNNSYKAVNWRDESYIFPSIEERFYGLRFQHGATELLITYNSPKVDFNVYTDDDNRIGLNPQLILNDKVNQELQSIFENSLKFDTALKSTVKQKLKKWNQFEQRRLQDTVTSFSVTSPVKISAIWQGRGAIQFEWENPDQQAILIVRSDKRDFTAIPNHDSTYDVGESIGDSTVVYSGSGTSYIDRELRDGSFYYYKIYAHGNLGYSSANVIRLSSGNGIRIMDSKFHSEIQLDGPKQGSADNNPDGYFDGDSGIIMYDSTYLARIVDTPGKKQVEIRIGNKPVMLAEDQHPPVGGAATYSGRIHYGKNQATSRQPNPSVSY